MVMVSISLNQKGWPIPPGWWEGGCTWCKHCEGIISKGRVRCKFLGDVDMYFGCYKNPRSNTHGTTDGCPYREPKWK